MEKKIEFKYQFPQDYNPVYVNGAHGGVNAQGELVINFYLERIALPISQTYELCDDGSLGNLIGKNPQNLDESIVRYVDNGVVMNLQTAKQLYQWLDRNISLMERKQESVSKNE